MKKTMTCQQYMGEHSVKVKVKLLGMVQSYLKAQLIRFRGNPLPRCKYTPDYKKLCDYMYFLSKPQSFRVISYVATGNYYGCENDN